MSETVRESPAAPAPESADTAPAAEIVVNEELDARGLNCPLPVLKTKKVIKGMAVGQVLKVISTDPGSVPDMAAFSRRTGHEIIQQSEGGGEYVFFFRKV